jgi:hypothetical protein
MRPILPHRRWLGLLRHVSDNGYKARSGPPLPFATDCVYMPSVCIGGHTPMRTELHQGAPDCMPAA